MAASAFFGFSTNHSRRGTKENAKTQGEARSLIEAKICFYFNIPLHSEVKKDYSELSCYEMITWKLILVKILNVGVMCVHAHTHVMS